MQKFITALFALLFILCIPAAVFGHGVDIEYRPVKAYQITARYDTGEPVSEGQVVVYAPGNPSEPWTTGTCDENGRYTFTPDPSKQGDWDVQVRKAGHGDMIHITAGSGDEAPGSTGFTAPQMAIMAACVIWGLIGTALFFARRRS